MKMNDDTDSSIISNSDDDDFVVQDCDLSTNSSSATNSGTYEDSLCKTRLKKSTSECESLLREMNVKIEETTKHLTEVLELQKCIHKEMIQPKNFIAVLHQNLSDAQIIFVFTMFVLLFVYFVTFVWNEIFRIRE